MALKNIEGDILLPTHLLLSLVVLLHDQDPEPRSWACAASGHVISRGLADPFKIDLVDRLLDLSETSLFVNVRVGVAVGLRVLAQNGHSILDKESYQSVLNALIALSKDLSFQVRREVSKVDIALEQEKGCENI